MKPTAKGFEKVVHKCGGNLTKVAEHYKVSRTCVYRWIDENPDLKDIITDARMRLFDECLTTARMVSLGIPEVQNGKIVGWIERPDSGMLRYLIGTLGRGEGFGEQLAITGKDGKALVAEPITVEIIDNRDKVDFSNPY